MEVNKEELKLAFIEFLKINPKTQVESIMSGIEKKIGRRPTQDEEKIILELIHEFSTSNILMPAMDRYNSGWPWLGLTEHGLKIINNAGPPVYDYNGYLDDLKKRELCP